ncbi:MAG: nuclear transport factor 2 family protein [Candidatus Aminicenantaceae bacterium]
MNKIALIVAVLFFLLMFMTVGMNAQDAAAKEAITLAALDYMDGAHAGDAARMERAVHPELHKVTVTSIPQTGTSFLRTSGSSRLIQLIAANSAPLAEDKRNIDLKILDVLEGLAVVRVTSAQFWDYLQLADIDGQWKIINVLWAPFPKPGQEKDNGGEGDAIKAAALDYIEGSFSGDADRMERALHPELHKVLPVKMPQTGKTRLDIMGAGMLIEGTRAKMGMLAEDKRAIEVTILDAAEDLAMVKILSSRYYDFLQMAKVGGKWKIINVLWVMNPAALRRR